jgi:hypothetical protein
VARRVANRLEVVHRVANRLEVVHRAAEVIEVWVIREEIRVEICWGIREEEIREEEIRVEEIRVEEIRVEICWGIREEAMVHVESYPSNKFEEQRMDEVTSAFLHSIYLFCTNMKNGT